MDAEAIKFLRKHLAEFLVFLRREIIKELEGQGHKASGALIRSLEIKIVQTTKGLEGQVWLNDYSRYLNTGVPAARIPFSGRRSGGGNRKSKFITALIRWAGFVKRGLSFKGRKSFAFAVAHKLKKEGMPTRGSFAFSKNGRRKGWEEQVADIVTPRFEEIAKIGLFMESIFDRILEIPTQ